MTGCLQAPIVAAPYEITVTSAKPVELDHDMWSMTVPANWAFEDEPVNDGKVTRLLHAQSNKVLGRAPVQLVITSFSYPGTPENFVDAMSGPSGDALSRGQEVVINAPMTINGVRAHVIISKSPKHLVYTTVGLASRNVGYLLTCDGDASADVGSEVVKTCIETIKTFRAK